MFMLESNISKNATVEMNSLKVLDLPCRRTAAHHVLEIPHSPVGDQIDSPSIGVVQADLR